MSFEEAILIGLFFIFGLCIGSFCNVLIYRMPRGLSVNFPASRCTNCNRALKFYHNIPLFSWLVLRGKCAFCNEKISPRYPLVELCGGILGALALWLERFDVIGAAFLGIALLLLLSLSIIDFEFRAVPEFVLLSAYFLALGAKFDGLQNFFSPDSSFIISLIFAGGITVLKSCVSVWINRKRAGETLESMGDADTIVIATIGVLLGGFLGLICIFIAAILQIILHIILRKNSEEAPFIPSLSLALLICLVFESQIREALNLYIEYASIK